MREEITYIANDGTKFASKEDCQEYDKKLKEREVANKEKHDMLESIRDKYSSLIEDIEKYQKEYKEPVALTKGESRCLTIPEILHNFFMV